MNYRGYDITIKNGSTKERPVYGVAKKSSKVFTSAAGQTYEEVVSQIKSDIDDAPRSDRNA
jgi:hypothetical protein